MDQEEGDRFKRVGEGGGGPILNPLCNHFGLILDYFGPILANFWNLLVCFLDVFVDTVLGSILKGFWKDFGWILNSILNDFEAVFGTA